MTEMYRRSFLKSSGLIAGAAASLSIARSVHAASDNVLKIALVGCGGRGTGAAQDCMKAAASVGQPIKLIALADAFEDRLQRALANLTKQWASNVDVPAERQFVGLDAYQKAIDCGPDLVLIATPPGFRPSQYEAAVSAGKHVFMEKPLCTDAPGYRKVVEVNEAADKKGLKVVVGLQRRHQKAYLEGIKEIHDGAVGDVRVMRVFWNGGSAPGFPPRPAGSPDEFEYQVRHWLGFRWANGDNIVEQHVHNIDVGNWVMDRDGDPMRAHPVEANGMGGRCNRSNYGDLFDHHFVEFTYPDGTKLFSQCRHQPGTWGIINEFVLGTKGERAVMSKMPMPPNEHDRPYVQEHINLLEAIRSDKKCNDGWHGAVSSMTAILGRMATYSGLVVRWDDAVAKGPNEAPDTFAWDAQPKSLPDQDGFYPYPMPGFYKPY